jgi:hypothetical protein
MNRALAVLLFLDRVLLERDVEVAGGSFTSMVRAEGVVAGSVQLLLDEAASRQISSSEYSILG